MCRLMTIGLAISLLFISLFAGYGCANTNQLNKSTIVLITDFGTDSYWVPQLKGIVYRQYPEANIIDATHDVKAFDVAGGAFILQIAAREFPDGVTFVAIIAPGDSSKDRFLVLTTKRNQTFLIPDNGLLTYVVRDSEIKSLYRINNEKLFGQPIETLFSSQILGRAGGMVASGLTVNDFGPEVTDPIMLDIKVPSATGNELSGTIVSIDKYGNCTTNIPAEMSRNTELKQGDKLTVSATDGSSFQVVYGIRYSDVAVGKEVVIINRLDFIEIAINMGNCSTIHNLKTGTVVSIVHNS